MTEITLAHDNTNPFDQIRLVDADGVEYWLARDLMPVLGYQQWRRFEDAISRAIAACENIGQESEKHFLPTAAKSTGGRTGDDYKLSRYACYLTAMNGDPRKAEIAAAQNYFAVKTREAELGPEILGQLLEKFEQQNRVIEEQSRAITLLQSQIQNLLPLPSDFIPPGWDADIWEKLPPQDKRHFKYLYRSRGFSPGSEVEVKALPAANRELQLAEIEHLINDVPEAEKQLIETARRVQLQRFWAQFGGES